MKMHLTLATIFLVSLSSLAQQKATGYVFEDLNQNGKKERNEKGIADISVTNGEAVVRTNRKGKYEIAVGEDNIIAVVKPSDYLLPVNENNLPQYYYVHKPKGSPKSQYEGVKPTGKLPKSIDFGLLLTENTDEFTALIFGDPQPYTMEHMDWFKRGIITEVEGIKNIPFGMSLGDLVGDNLDLFKPYISAIKDVGIPWFNVMGNHDMNFDATHDSLSDETFEDHFGPANYAFNYGKVHFIVLDDILYPDPRDQDGYYGGFRDDQLNFIENDLQYVPKDNLIVLSYHIPLSNTDGDSFSEKKRNRLFEILKPFPNTLSLSAHTHTQRQDVYGKEQGWLQDDPHHEYIVGTTSGDWYGGKLDEKGVPIAVMRDGTPKGYAFIHFKGNSYSVDYKVAGKSKDFQMEISAPNVVAKEKYSKARIFVNFFMGKEGDEVLCRIDDGSWEKMDYTEEADPSYIKLVYEWDTAEELMPGRRSSNPSSCEHLWKTRILGDLELGMHTIEIKAIDMYGKVHTGKTTYRIENLVK